MGPKVSFQFILVAGLVLACLGQQGDIMGHANEEAAENMGEPEDGVLEITDFPLTDDYPTNCTCYHLHPAATDDPSLAAEEQAVVVVDCEERLVHTVQDPADLAETTTHGTGAADNDEDQASMIMSPKINFKNPRHKRSIFAVLSKTRCPRGLHPDLKGNCLPCVH